MRDVDEKKRNDGSCFAVLVILIISTWLIPFQFCEHVYDFKEYNKPSVSSSESTNCIQVIMMLFTTIHEPASELHRRVQVRHWVTLLVPTTYLHPHFHSSPQHPLSTELQISWAKDIWILLQTRMGFQACTTSHPSCFRLSIMRLSFNSCCLSCGCSKYKSSSNSFLKLTEFRPFISRKEVLHLEEEGDVLSTMKTPSTLLRSLVT